MNRPHCTDDAMAERLFDVARRRKSFLSSDELSHLGACDACQVGVERMRRLQATRRLLEPSAAESAAAFARFAARVRPRRRLRPVSLVAAVVLLLAVVATAAARIVSTNRARPAVVGEVMPRARVARAHRVPSMPRATPASDEQAPVVQAPVVEALVVRNPGVRTIHRPHTKRSFATGGAASAPESMSAPAATTFESGDWRVAAEAMRAGDHRRAERAFDRLASAADAHTRDAARLARAQLWISEGRDAEARGELETLSRQGATALIRQRAAEALEGERN